MMRSPPKLMRSPLKNDARNAKVRMPGTHIVVFDNDARYAKNDEISSEMMRVLLLFVYNNDRLF